MTKSMTALISLGFLQAPTPATPAAEATMAFAGQWAPPPAGAKFPVVPKPCFQMADPAQRSACLEHVVRDWPRLERYAAANAALAVPAKGERRVVFMGDSITDFWSKPAAGAFFPGKRYVNRGISSQTTGQMLLRFRADVIALAPRAVVILAGTNDIAGNGGPMTPDAIQNNLASMAELARSHRIGVVLASLLPVCDCKAGPDGKPIQRTQDRPHQSIAAINKWIADYAKKNRFVHLDYHRALADQAGAIKAELTDDGLHPNAAGYAVMGPMAEKAIAAVVR